MRPARIASAPRAAFASDYARVERAIRFLQANAPARPALAEVAAQVGLSEFHFQRLFQRWAGVSPKRFLQMLSLSEARRALEESRSVLEASCAAGVSGPGRLHDLFLSIERMTPGAYRLGARGVVVRWAIAPTPFGDALVAAVEQGVCGIWFLDEGRAAAEAALRERWPEATLCESPADLAPHLEALRARFDGRQAPLAVLLKGSPLQLKVWEALLRIPPGCVASYSGVARLAGAPQAPRAVASAVAQNALAWLIPCHRVIRSTGVLGEYRWGAVRKLALFAAERARRGAS